MKFLKQYYIRSLTDRSQDENLSQLFYGNVHRYTEPNLNYKSDVLPYLIKIYMERLLKHKDEYLYKLEKFGFSYAIEFVRYRFLYILKDTFVLHRDMSENSVIFNIFSGRASKKNIVKYFKEKNGICYLLLKNKRFREAIYQYTPSDRFANKLEKCFNQMTSGAIYYVPNLIEKGKRHLEPTIDDSDIDFAARYDDDNYRNFDDKSTYTSANEELSSVIAILLFLDNLPKQIQIYEHIPCTYKELFEEFLHFMFMSFIYVLDKKDIEELVSRYTITMLSTLKKTKVENVKGIKINDNSLLIENMKFEKNASKFLYRELIYNQFGLFEYIGFRNCLFNGECKTLLANHQTSLFYENCEFLGNLPIECTNNGININFLNCHFHKKVDCTINDDGINYPYDIYFQNSYFDEGSSLDVIRGTRFLEFHNLGSLTLKDIIFRGALNFKNILGKDNFVINLDGLVFFEPFTIDNCFFPQESTIRNIAISTKKTESMEKSIEQLAKSLRASDMWETIKELGLTKSDYEEKSTSDIQEQNVSDDGSFLKFKQTDTLDMQSYRLACESGFLKPKYAAYFLGMSKDNLAKKRMADKKQITRESIPYLGEGKYIVYPIDALQAFKASDWALLKELRERYAKNESDDDDF
ncbi:MAG: hypothetical protein IJE43_21980 [Alphaproteobacteria bacterium]|nr:hypothetical protein [Alphaproteobacteria bacterium]